MSAAVRSRNNQQKAAGNWAKTADFLPPVGKRVLLFCDAQIPGCKVLIVWRASGDEPGDFRRTYSAWAEMFEPDWEEE